MNLISDIKKPYEKVVYASYSYPQSLDEYGNIFGGIIYCYKDDNNSIFYQYKDEISRDFVSMYIKFNRDRHTNEGSWVNYDDIIKR